MLVVMKKLYFKGSTKLKKIKELAQYLKIISDENRLQILCFLQKGERCVCEIYKDLDLKQNLTSHHLKALKDEGLVIARREGKWIYYSINFKKIHYLDNLYQQVILRGIEGIPASYSLHRPADFC